jgi:hypothetical protein
VASVEAAHVPVSKKQANPITATCAAMSKGLKRRKQTSVIKELADAKFSGHEKWVHLPNSTYNGFVVEWNLGGKQDARELPNQKVPSSNVTAAQYNTGAQKVLMTFAKAVNTSQQLNVPRRGRNIKNMVTMWSGQLTQEREGKPYNLEAEWQHCLGEEEVR